MLTGQPPAAGRHTDTLYAAESNSNTALVRECVCYLEDFSLAGVGVCVLLPSLLRVMLVLPLGPDFTGTTLELGSALTALP